MLPSCTSACFHFIGHDSSSDSDVSDDSYYTRRSPLDQGRSRVNVQDHSRSRSRDNYVSPDDALGDERNMSLEQPIDKNQPPTGGVSKDSTLPIDRRSEESITAVSADDKNDPGAPARNEAGAVVGEEATANSATASNQESAGLDVEILKAIGCRYLQDRQLSDPINDQMALRWEDIVKQGLPQEDREKIAKKYATPKNCIFMDAPKLNLDVKNSLAPSICKRDERIVEKQQKLASALSAVGLISNELLKYKPVNLKFLETASDLGSLITDVQHDEINIRKTLILANLNNAFKETLKDTTADAFLFGKDLEERVKARELIERSSKKLRPTPKSTTFNNPKNLKTPARTRKPRPMTSSSGYKPTTSTRRNQASPHYKDRSNQQRTPYPQRKRR